MAGDAKTEDSEAEWTPFRIVSTKVADTTRVEVGYVSRRNDDRWSRQMLVWRLRLGKRSVRYHAAR